MESDLISSSMNEKNQIIIDFTNNFIRFETYSKVRLAIQNGVIGVKKVRVYLSYGQLYNELL
jgi:hypothetical protein